MYQIDEYMFLSQGVELQVENCYGRPENFCAINFRVIIIFIILNFHG